MNIDDRIGQLDSLRLKTQMAGRNLSKEKIGKNFPENEMPGMRKAIPKGAIANTVIPLGKLKLAEIEKAVPFSGPICGNT